MLQKKRLALDVGFAAWTINMRNTATEISIHSGQQAVTPLSRTTR